MASTTFVKCNDWEQVNELRTYLKKVGAEKIDKAEVTEQNWCTALIKYIPHLRVCFKSDKVSDTAANDVLTTVASLIVRLPHEHTDKAVEKLCTVYEDFSDSKNRKHYAKLYSLNILFTVLPEAYHCRYRIYRALVTCAAELGALSQIHTQVEKVDNLLKVCKCTPSECQALWRQMSQIHQTNGNTKQATEAMINLLSTYSEGDAAGARDDAIKCILAVIQDPSFLSLGRLLSLKPVQFLEGEPIHKLLEIYVSGGLSDFAAFVTKNPNFLVDNGLDDRACINKLRTLSLMEVAENATELDYSTVAKIVDIPEDEVESFIIEAVRQRVISCKLDQINRRILISGGLPRNFGQLQWQNLYKRLKEWESGLRVVQSGLAKMIGPSAQ